MRAEASLRLRPMTEPDLALLAGWIEQPHVRRWWHDPVGSDEVRAHYLPCVQGTDPTHALILELNGQPAGFAQWYRWADHREHADKLGAAEDEAGMDYLIGIEQFCGRGVGTRLIIALVDQIQQGWPAVGGVVVDPEVANQASRRVLTNNGFELTFCAQLEAPPYGPSAVHRLRFSAPLRSPGTREPR